MSIFGAASDVVVRVSSDNSLAPERRISPSWSIAQLKLKLELVTGVPPLFQSLTLRLPHSSEPIAIEGVDEESVHVADFPFQPYAELHVCGSFLSLKSTSLWTSKGPLFHVCPGSFFGLRFPPSLHGLLLCRWAANTPQLR